MIKKWYTLLSFIILFVLYLGYTSLMHRIDTKYAIDFSNVFSTYDINSIDNYLSDETMIICNNKHANYTDLRNNVETACNERKYQFEGSYGYGNNKFENNVQRITVYLFGKLDGQSIGEVNISMNLKKIGLYRFEIISLECNDDIFEYLFYGNKYE